MQKAWNEWRAVLKAADSKRDAYIDAHNAYLKLLNESEKEVES